MNTETPAWLRRVRAYRAMYERLLDDGYSHNEAAHAVDVALTTDALRRSLKREPTYEEVKAALANL